MPTQNPHHEKNIHLRTAEVGLTEPNHSLNDEGLPAAESTPTQWPPQLAAFPELLSPVEAAQYLRLDETGAHSPQSAIRTLNYWRDRGELKATKFARRVWYRRAELDRFLAVKTET
jgi:hypothetical protein